MKRLIPILLALTILIPSSAGSWGPVMMRGGVTGGGETLYFGVVTSTAGEPDNNGTDDNGGEGSTTSIYHYNDSFTCPGSGNQLIQELSIYSKVNASSPTVYLGVYDSDGNLVALGTAAVALSGGTLTWQGHMTQASVKANGGASPGVLTGGAQYRLYCLFTGGTAGFTTKTGQTSGDSQYRAYGISAPPATIPMASATSVTTDWVIRCGVKAE